MMRGSIALPAALMMAAGACGPSAPPAPAPTADNGTRERVRAMEPGARNATFVRAIRDAGLACQHVAQSTYQREIGSLSLWVADCGADGLWAIYVGGAGGAQVAACSRGADGRPMCGGAPG